MRGIPLGLLGTAVLAGAIAHPAQDGLDAYMRHLAVAGNVQVVNETVQIPGLHALTNFTISYHARWDYEVEVERAGSQFALIITPKVKSVETQVRHTLKLPEGNEQRSHRYRVLLLHEYDHVAISTDGRVKVLLNSLIANMGKIRVPWQGPIPPPSDAVNASITAEMEARKAAVVRLVSHAYKALDRESDHGRQSLPQRSSFFLKLFTGQYLEEANFPYRNEAKSILASPEYKLAQQYYRY